MKHTNAHIHVHVHVPAFVDVASSHIIIDHCTTEVSSPASRASDVLQYLEDLKTGRSVQAPSPEMPAKPVQQVPESSRLYQRPTRPVKSVKQPAVEQEVCL